MKKYAAVYFNKTRKIIEKYQKNAVVVLQFFQRKNDTLLCGINEVLTLLKKETDISKYKIRYLKEGTKINAKDVVLELEGCYEYFGIYEGIIDGILARATSLATNAYKIKQETTKPIIFMGDRADHYFNQSSDGYAINLGGINTQVTKAQVEHHDGKAIGTIPHVLIQMFKGDLVQALKAYQATFPEDSLTALVDFHNDVLGDSLKCIKEFGRDLKYIRVDTSKDVSDVMFKNKLEYGVTHNMIMRLRQLLDENNGQHVKIIVSSGINKQKVRDFEKLNTPIDVYGIGGSLLKINHSFTADAVKINGNKIAKVGRKYKSQKGLITYII